MSAIAPAFIKAKQAFSPALKDKTNPAFRSKYADLGACIDAVDDALLAHGIVMYQETSLDETGITVETVLLHESGETIRGGKLHVPSAKQDPQGYGSALTYARRYSLMATCGIAAEDDDGNAASAPKAQTKPAAQKTAAQPAGVDLMPLLAALDAAADADELKATFASAWKESSGHPAIKKHYDKLKAKFLGEQE